MFATAGGHSFPGNPLTWNLFFARQPEPDLEFTEEELEQTSNIRASAPMKPPKKQSGKSPLLWVILLVLIGGGAYVAMEPDMIMEFVGPLLGDTPEPAAPVVKKPAAANPPVRPAPAAAAPAAPAVEPPRTEAQTQAQAPTPPSGAVPSMLAPPVPAQAAQPASAASAPAAENAPPVTESPNPLFGEGQRVTLLPNPGAPRDKVALMRDAAGTQTGPAVPPGTNFTILDGDLQDRGWVYHVRSDYGTKGWLGENQLQAKR